VQCALSFSRPGTPSLVLGGEELILDCDFDYQEEEQLDLKYTHLSQINVPEIAS
jgi:hypothetical protein